MNPATVDYPVPQPPVWHDVPPSLACRPQWLLWRLEFKEGQAKPAKMPYYASGAKRTGGQGSDEDRSRLVTLADAKAAYERGGWSGVGFGFLPGDGLIGIDIDGAIEPETGAVSERCAAIVKACASFTEYSPSGKGVHIIVLGDTTTNKSNDIGLEVFAKKQFFTFTAKRYPDTPADVLPIDAGVLRRLHATIDEAKAARKVVSIGKLKSFPVPPAGDGKDDFKKVNDVAMLALGAWVPSLLPAARPHGDGFRATSKALGRDLQEDLSITPNGIQDFGLEQGFSPIDLVMKWLPAAKPQDAMKWLAQRIGVELSPVPQRRSAAEADSPAAGSAAASEPGDWGSVLPFQKKAKRGEAKPIDWGKFDYLVENFALIYGSDTVWDGGRRLIMKLANMAHAHGSDLVKMWKGSEKRRTVMPSDVVFDPTEKCDLSVCVNLFDGIKMEPVAGDVKPVLELLRFLCSRAGIESDECDSIMHWLLCWVAYPLQKPGAKLRTAVIMHGDEGAGKNMFFDMVASIYGKYGALVGQDELEDKFNDWRSCKLLVIGDEVSSRQELVHNKNRLKGLITSETVQINPKNLPRREEANHMNVVFLSNEITPLALDNSDRRYLVVYTPKAKPFEYYKAIGKWRDSGGTEAFYAYLLAYPLGGFDPYAPAPATVAKRDLIDINRKTPERFWLAWHGGELDLPYHPCTVGQIYRAYLKYAQRVGDRFPVQQALFTRMVLRISEGEGVPAREKVMALEGAVGARKTERMFLTIEPPHDRKQGEWATMCRETFEKELSKYVGAGFPRSPGENE